MLPCGDDISKIISKPRIIDRARRSTTADCPARPG
jgi:hypothetical protein